MEKSSRHVSWPRPSKWVTLLFQRKGSDGDAGTSPPKDTIAATLKEGDEGERVEQQTGRNRSLSLRMWHKGVRRSVVWCTRKTFWGVIESQNILKLRVGNKLDVVRGDNIYFWKMKALCVGQAETTLLPHTASRCSTMRLLWWTSCSEVTEEPVFVSTDLHCLHKRERDEGHEIKAGRDGFICLRRRLRSELLEVSQIPRFFFLKFWSWQTDTYSWRDNQHGALKIAVRSLWRRVIV